MRTLQDPSVALLQRAAEALKRGDWREAEKLARTLLQRGPEANALMVLASVRAEAGDTAEAIGLYERARTLMPTHIHVLVNLAALYRATGRLQDARGSLDAALRVDPRFAVAHNNLGNVLSDLGERQLALRSYERAAALDAQYAEPVAGLAGIAEEEHRLDEARVLAERALNLAPQNVSAGLTLARVKARQDDAQGAAGILETLLRTRTLSVTNRIFAHGALGDAYDRLGRYRDAFGTFTLANELQHEQCAAMIAGERGPLTPRSVARLREFVVGADPSGWSPAPASTATPVFLVGFPRSGTTLLDQILASHPEVTTLEERDTLIDATNELMAPEADYEHWAALPGEVIERLRGLYWQRVRTACSNAPLRRVFIDKQPLNAVLLPLIYRLFPSARIILALRDPRDVLLSCYQQRFAINVAMYQLLRLDTATAYYDAVMGLVGLCRGKLPLRFHAVKYEDVVTRLEVTMSAALEFLELAWDPGLHRFSETAGKRTINTPSASQVVRPLYGSARGRWRNYAQFLSPYFPKLMPWVHAFGYPSN